MYMRKIKILICILMVLFAQKSFASIRITQNKEASSAQNKCVLNLSIAETLSPNYDTLTAYVNIKSKEAGFNEDVPLVDQNGTGVAEITAIAPMPAEGESKTYNFESTLYMARRDSGTDVKIGTKNASFVCKSILFEQNELIKNQIAQQRTGMVTSTLSNQVFMASQRMGGGEFMVGNNSYTISGIGSALIGCSNVSSWGREKLGELFGSVSTNQEKVGVNDSKDNAKESCGDRLAYAASRLVIENMSRAVINWANSGNDGTSFFPQDYQSLFQNVKNKQVEDFVKELRNGNNSSPFSSSAARSAAQMARNNTRSFAERTRYSGPNAEFFQDFRSGGWEAWYSYILVPQNNPIGYGRLLSEEKSNRQNTAINLLQNELTSNNGFLSQKVCADKGYRKWTSDAERVSAETLAKSGDKNAIKRIEQATCKTYKIATPGSLIAEQVKQAIGTPMRQAEQADEINESLGSLFDAMTVNLVSKGLTNLSQPSFRDRVNFSFNSSTNTLDQPTGGTFWEEFGTNFDLRRDLPNIINTQKAYVLQLEKNNLAISTVLQGIERMDMVMPGPGLLYFESEDFNTSYLREVSKIENRYDSQNKESRKIQNFQEDIGLYRALIEEVYKDRLNLKTYQEVYEGVSTRQSYQNILALNQRDITAVKDLIKELEIIQKGVDDLYKRACERFKTEKPGAICI